MHEVGIIGAGSVSTGHLQAVTDLESTHLQAVADIDAERLARACAEYACHLVAVLTAYMESSRLGRAVELEA